MSNRLFYPALFHKADEGGFWVSFPDLPECLTQGETMDEAYAMAIEALGLCLTEKKKNALPIPAASDLSCITAGPEAFLVIIEFDMLAYEKRNNAKAIKKTLTIPEWLNEEATDLGINFSQVLQEALMMKLGHLQ